MHEKYVSNRQWEGSGPRLAEVTVAADVAGTTRIVTVSGERGGAPPRDNMGPLVAHSLAIQHWSPSLGCIL